MTPAACIPFIYAAALGRQPEPSAVQYWETVPTAEAAAYIVRSEEALASGRGVSDWYSDVLGRPSEPGAVTWWSNAYVTGGSGTLLAFLNSPEAGSGCNAPDPAVQAMDSVETLIKDAASEYGVNSAMMLRIGRCESGYDPEARNPHSTATGVFQFLKGTWAWVRTLDGAPYPDGDVTNPVHNVYNAAFLMARTSVGGVAHWNASKGCWG